MYTTVIRLKKITCTKTGGRNQVYIVPLFNTSSQKCAVVFITSKMSRVSSVWVSLCYYTNVGRLLFKMAYFKLNTDQMGATRKTNSLKSSQRLIEEFRNNNLEKNV